MSELGGRLLRRFVSALIAVCWTTAAFGQIEAANLQPLDDWQVEVLGDRCIVRRSFGDPSLPTTIELRNIDPWHFGYQTAIYSRKYAASGEAFRAVWLPGGKVEEVERFSIVEDADGASGILMNLGMQDAAMEVQVIGQDGPFNVVAIDPDYDFEVSPRRFREGIEGLLVLGAFELPLLIATGPMQSVMDAREPCINQVLASHGVDPADADRDDHRVEMSNGRMLAERVIRRVPSEIRRRDRPTSVTFLLYVDAEAQPSSCRLASLPYDAEYEQSSCELLMRRAQFRFKDGEAAQATFFILSGFYVP